VLPPGEPRRAEAIVLPPGERYKRKQRECCHWGTSYGAYATGGVLPPGEPRRAKAIVLPPGERHRRKQRECCHWGESHKEMLPPGERCRAEAINVLPPGNAGGGSRGSAATGGTP